MPKKLKIFSLKIHKDADIFLNSKAFLNKVRKQKIYMDALNSKNKNI